MLRIFMHIHFVDRIFMALSNSLAAGNSGLMSRVRCSLAINHHVVGLLDAFVVPVSVEREATPYSVYDIACPDVLKLVFKIHQQLWRAAWLG